MRTVFLLSFLLSAFMFSCNVEKEQSGEMPEVDVDVKEGEAPEYDVNWADVQVNTKTKTVKVPKVIVTMEEEEVEVPSIDVSMPNGDSEKELRTIRVEAEVSETMHELEIKKVYAVNNKLIIISELEKESQSLGEERVRVSDQIEINAPADLAVRHYIIGERPAGVFNENYNYITSETEVQSYIADGKLIYED